MITTRLDALQQKVGSLRSWTSLVRKASQQAPLVTLDLLGKIDHGTYRNWCCSVHRVVGFGPSSGVLAWNERGSEGAGRGKLQENQISLCFHRDGSVFLVVGFANKDEQFAQASDSESSDTISLLVSVESQNGTRDENPI
jgi:hypothetical protein